MIEKFSLLLLLSPYPLIWLLASLIPALFLGALTAFIGFILDKISHKQARAIAPVIISLALGFLLILADLMIGTAIEPAASSLLLVLESLVIITLFDRVREKIPFQRKWLAIVITGVIVYLVQSMLSFFYAVDRYGPLTLSHGNVFLPSFVVFVVYAIPISAATLGIFLFLKRSEDDKGFRKWRFIKLIILFCGVIFFTPFLFIGGLAVYFFTFLKEAKRPITPIVASLAGATILAIIGSVVNRHSGCIMVEHYQRSVPSPHQYYSHYTCSDFHRNRIFRKKMDVAGPCLWIDFYGNYY